MHELYVTKSIQQIVLKHAQKNGIKKVITVNLEIGALSDLQDEWLQRYFDRLSLGTVVEGARLRIRRVPAVFQCCECQQTYQIHSFYVQSLTCPHCSSAKVTLQTGREFRILNMEAE